jgi:hypothetical protein
MALPAALFTQAAPYAAWEFWVHLLSGGAIALGAAAALAWAVRYVLATVGRRLAACARGLLVLALATVAAALWVVGTPPALVVRAHPLAVDMAAALSQSTPSTGADPSVTAPAWAQRAALDILNSYGPYALGSYSPPTPPGYRLALVIAPPVSSLSGLIAHGDSAPVPRLARQVLGTFLNEIPVSTQGELVAAGGGAVGAVSGLAVTAQRRTPVILLAVFVRTHG